MADSVATSKREVHTNRQPKRFGVSVEMEKKAQVKTMPNLEVDQKDA